VEKGYRPFLATDPLAYSAYFQASDRDDVVRDGGGLPARSGRRSLGGGEALGVPPGRVEGERGQGLLGGGEAPLRVLIPGPGRDRGVLDDQQEPADPHDAGGGLQDPCAREVEWRVQVEGGDQVEAAVREGLGQIVSLAGDAVADTGGGRALGDPAQGGGRDVDGGDAPALPGEPDRVAPFAAAEFQRGARLPSRDDRDQEGIGIAAPRLLALAIVIVPEPRGLALAAPIIRVVPLLIVAHWSVSSRSRRCLAGELSQ